MPSESPTRANDASGNPVHMWGGTIIHSVKIPLRLALWKVVPLALETGIPCTLCFRG